MLNIPANRGGGGSGVPAAIVAMFGDGVDGDLTLVSGQAQSLPEWLSTSDYITYDVLRDANPITFTIGVGCTVRTHGWTIIASVSIVNDGTIHADGVDADGLNGGRDVPAGSDWPYSLPALVGKQTTPFMNNGYHGSTNSDGDSTYGPGGGGYGGPGGGGPAGNDGTVEAASPYLAIFRCPGYPGESRYVPEDIDSSISVPAGGAGGGGGSTFGTGGGGGMGGQIIELCAPIITNTGTIRSAGGNGGSFGGLPDAGCGGGGGGGGGMIFITYTTEYTNSGTVHCPGGLGGAGSLGNDGQARDGLDGGDGPVIILAL